MPRDIKRRDTRNYLLATAGNKKIVLWYLDPYTGDVSHERIVCEARGSLVRDIQALSFSEDGEILRCATSTGDFVGVDLRSKQVTYNSRRLACALAARTNDRRGIVLKDAQSPLTIIGWGGLQ